MIIKNFIFFIIFSNYSLLASTANYTIDSGILHNGGEAKIETSTISDEKLAAKMHYQIYRKKIIPIPENALKGETTIEFPSEFKDERGILELETKGSIVTSDATIKFLKKIKWKNLDAYKILIIPKNGKFKIEAIYHHSLPGLGLGEIKFIFCSSFPLLNGQEALLTLK